MHTCTSIGLTQQKNFSGKAEANILIMQMQNSQMVMLLINEKIKSKKEEDYI